MNRRLFLERVDEARADWEEVIAAVPGVRWEEAIEPGSWTPKDVVAHVAWHEREMLGVARERALVGLELWESGVDERNAAILAESRDRPLADVLAEARRVWADLRRELDGLTDADLSEPARCRDLEEILPGVAPWALIGGNTFEHHEHHAAELRVWMRRPSRVTAAVPDGTAR